MPTPNEGGDSQNQDPTVANQSQSGKPAPKRDPVLSARDRLLEDMDAQITERRAAENEEFLRGADPRAAAFYAEMQSEAAGLSRSADETQGNDPSADVEGRPITEEPPRDDRGRFTAQVQADGSDPLADYVVREAGKPPMFKTIVDGQVRLIPLETARAQLQKHLVADQRLEQAANRRKELSTWETQLRQKEAALNSQSRPAAPVDDKALETEAVELVRSLVSDPEVVAAQKLAKTLAKVRGTAPAVDVNAISRQAAQVAKQELAAENIKRALTTGLSEFQKSYPEIVEGSELYLVADRKTTAIAEEHPDWSPGQVMMEAGRLTREWVAELSGKPVGKTVVQMSQSRQQLKQSLKPMPSARSARPAAAADANEEPSAQDVLAEIRKSRGQYN